MDKTGLIDTPLHYALRKTLYLHSRVRTSIVKNLAKKKGNLEELKERIPYNIIKILDDDYDKTIYYCREEGLLIE